MQHKSLAEQNRSDSMFTHLRRERKANRLANALSAMGFTADFAAGRTQSERTLLAQRAGEQEPHESWEIAVSMLRDREKAIVEFADERKVLAI